MMLGIVCGLLQVYTQVFDFSQILQLFKSNLINILIASEEESLYKHTGLR